MSVQTAPVGLQARLSGAGRKLLVPYLTAGVVPDWTDYLHAYAEAGADAIEVGLAFSDPMIDGATVQEACDRALARGSTVATTLAELRDVRVEVPLVTMTYAHLAHRPDPARFCDALGEAGISGLIVADLPLQESAPLERIAADRGIDLVLLAAPTSSPSRLSEIAARSRGFIYAVSVMGTTGERGDLAGTARVLADALKARSDRPVLLGLGISNAEQAVEAARSADGIVIGSSLMRRVMDGADPASAGAWLGRVRAALDREFPVEPTAST